MQKHRKGILSAWAVGFTCAQNFMRPDFVCFCGALSAHKVLRAAVWNAPRRAMLSLHEAEA